MKKVNFCAGIFFVLFLCLFAALPADAQENPEKGIPEGMELRQVGDTRLIVPRDARVYEEHGLIVVEGIDKYVARMLEEIRISLAELKEKQAVQGMEITALKDTLEDIKKDRQKPESAE